MNKLITIIITLFFSLNIFSAEKSKGFQIDITVKGVKDTTLLLGYHFGENKFVKDTAYTDAKGHTVFKGDSALTGGIYLIILPNKTYFEIIVDKDQNFAIETDTIDFIGNMKIIGSVDNKLFNDYQKYMAEKQKLGNMYNNRIKTINPTNDSLEIYKKLLSSIGSEIESYRDNIIKSNPDILLSNILKSLTPISVPDAPRNEKGELIDSNWSYKYYRKHFFDNIDLTDSRMLRTPVIHEKIMQYVGPKMTLQMPDSIAASMVEVLDKTVSNQEIFRYCLVTLMQHSEKSKFMGMDKVFVVLSERYYLSGLAQWPDSTTLAKINEQVMKIKPNLIGLKAPYFEVWDTIGRPFSPYTMNEDFVVLFFYDPTCGHCKKMTKAIKDIYWDLKDKNTEVIGINTTTDEKAWKKYLEEQELEWINCSDLDLKSYYRGRYNIYSTPVIYLLNKERVIIAKRIGAEQLIDFIDNYKKFNN